MGRSMDVAWTRERVEQLVALRQQGPSPTEIGDELSFARNAVIGTTGEPQFRASSLDPEFAIGNGSKVRTRGSLGCRAVALGSVAQPFFGSYPYTPPMM